MNPPVTGSVSGIIGAGGNTGAVLFGLFFRQLSAQDAFILMGGTIMLSSILSIFIFIKGQPGLIWRTTLREGPPGAAINAVVSGDEVKSEEQDTMNTASISDDTTSSGSGSITAGCD